MYPLLLWLIAMLTPAPADVLAGLSSPKFGERQRACAELQRRMSWPLAVRLSIAPPADAEARKAVRAVLDDYWRIEAPAKWPPLDMMPNGNRCFLKDDPDWIKPCLAVAEAEGHYANRYYSATGVWVRAQRQALLPPEIIRANLREFEKRAQGVYRPMPQPPKQSAEPPQNPVRR